MYLFEYLGTSEWDIITSIDVFSDKILLSGTTHGDNYICKPSNFPNSFYSDTRTGEDDAIITEVSSSGANVGKILYSTYIGSGANEEDYSSALKTIHANYTSYGEIVFIGATNGGTNNNNTATVPIASNPPSGYYWIENKIGEIGIQNSTYDIFIEYFNQEHELIWSTYLGSDMNDFPAAIYCDTYEPNNYNLLIAGKSMRTNSIQYPTVPLTNPSQLSLFYTNPLAPNQQPVYDGFLSSFHIFYTPMASVLPNLPNENGIIVFPNPSSDKLHISAQSSFIDQILVTDILGNTIVKYENLGGIEVDFEVSVKNITPGTYSITFIDIKGDFVSKKFIKI